MISAGRLSIGGLFLQCTSKAMTAKGSPKKKSHNGKKAAVKLLGKCKVKKDNARSYAPRGTASTHAGRRPPHMDEQKTAQFDCMKQAYACAQGDLPRRIASAPRNLIS